MTGWTPSTLLGRLEMPEYFHRDIGDMQAMISPSLHVARGLPFKYSLGCMRWMCVSKLYHPLLIFLEPAFMCRQYLIIHSPHLFYLLRWIPLYLPIFKLDQNRWCLLTSLTPMRVPKSNSHLPSRMLVLLRKCRSWGKFVLANLLLIWNRLSWHSAEYRYQWDELVSKAHPISHLSLSLCTQIFAMSSY